MTGNVWRHRALGWMVFCATAAGASQLTACGGSNGLYGSISTTNNLQYDTVTLGVQQTTLTVSYTRKTGELVAKLAIDTNGLSLASGAVLNTPQFLTNVSLTRVVTDQNQVFPTGISKGTITFHDYSTSPGASLSGHFAVIFDTGFTLEGDFSGNLVDQNTTAALHFNATEKLARSIFLRSNAPSTSRVRHAPDMEFDFPALACSACAPPSRQPA